MSSSFRASAVFLLNLHLTCLPGKAGGKNTMHNGAADKEAERTEEDQLPARQDVPKSLMVSSFSAWQACE